MGLSYIVSPAIRFFIVHSTGWDCQLLAAMLPRIWCQHMQGSSINLETTPLSISMVQLNPRCPNFLWTTQKIASITPIRYRSYPSISRPFFFHFPPNVGRVNMSTSVGLRYVDQIPVRNPRPVEMQVLCLGLSRTGTMCWSLPRYALVMNTNHGSQRSTQHLTS